MEPDMLERRIRDAYQTFELDLPVDTIQQRTTRRTPTRPMLRLATAVGAVTVIAALAVALVPNAPPAVATIEFPDGRTIDIAEMFDPASFAELEKRFEEVGAELVIDELPVAPQAVGRVLGVQYPPDANTGNGIRLRLEGPLSEPVIVTLGVEADPLEATTAGLTIYEVFPELGWAVDLGDPIETADRLDTLGFEVHWTFIEFDPPAPDPDTGVMMQSAAGSAFIDSPESDDVIITVMRGPDSWHEDEVWGRGPVWETPDINPEHRSLMIEVVDDIDSVGLNPVSCR